MSYDLNSLNVVLLCLFSVLIGISLGGLVVFVHSSRLHLSAGIDSDLLPLPLWRMVMKGKIVRCMWVLVPLALLLPYCKPGMYVDAGLVSFAFVGFWTFAISRDWYQLPKKAQELHDQALKLFGCQSFTARLSAIEEETIGGSPYKYHCVLTDLSGEKMLFYPTSDKDLAKMWGVPMSQESLSLRHIGEMYTIYYRHDVLVSEPLVWMPVSIMVMEKEVVRQAEPAATPG